LRDVSFFLIRIYLLNCNLILTLKIVWRNKCGLFEIEWRRQSRDVSFQASQGGQRE